MQRPAPRGWSGLPAWTQPEAQRKSCVSRLETRTHSVCYGASGTWPHRTSVSLGTHLTAGRVISRAFELAPWCTGHQHHAKQTWPPRQMAMVPTKDGTTPRPGSQGAMPRSRVLLCREDEPGCHPLEAPGSDPQPGVRTEHS